MSQQFDTASQLHKKHTQKIGLNWSEYSGLESMIRSRMRSRKGRKIRPRNKILIEILESCRTPSVEHWIMIKARLGYETFWMHMSNLLRDGKMTRLRTEQKRGKSKTYYYITQDGLFMLEQLRSDIDSTC